MQRIEEIYRARLLLLVQMKGKGRQRILAELIDKSPAQLSQWINASKDSKTGQPRSMDKKTAREVEKKLGLPQGWMDQPVTETESEALPADLRPVGITLESRKTEYAVRPRPDLAESLEVLAAACATVPADVRANVLQLVSLVVTNPVANASDQIPIIVRKLSGETLPTAVGQN